MSDLRCWKNPLIPADTRVQIADGEIERLRAELAASREREVRMREALGRISNCSISMYTTRNEMVRDMQRIADAALAEGAQG